MNDILAAVNGGSDDEDVLAAAVDRAEADGAHLVVLYAMPTGEYDARQGATAGVGALGYGPGVYGITGARDDARVAAERVAALAVGDRDVEYEAVGAVGGIVPAANATAAEYGCETVVLGETRSRLGRLLGRAERRFARGFGGTVVRVPRAGRSAPGNDGVPAAA